MLAFPGDPGFLVDLSPCCALAPHSAADYCGSALSPSSSAARSCFCELLVAAFIFDLEPPVAYSQVRHSGGDGDTAGGRFSAQSRHRRARPARLGWLGRVNGTMTALNGAPGLEQDMGGLAALPGLEMVSEQLAGWFTVLRAEQARRRAGTTISRQAWLNLVFTGGPGTGKSRAAQAVASIYHDLGVLHGGHLFEVAAADLAGTTPRETAALFGGVVKLGNVLMITEAHTVYTLPDRGQRVLRCLYQRLTEARQARHLDDLAMILAGQAGPLRDLLRSSPPLAACFPLVCVLPLEPEPLL